MVKTTSITNFVKQFDRYSNNISLTYNSKKSMETTIGGVCSIFTFIFLTYVFVMNVVRTFVG